MALNLASYSGVPLAEAQFGTLTTTGLAGTSRVGDYSVPVFAPDGTRLTDPNMVIPAGAQVYLGYVPSTVATGAGQQTVTGTQIPLDAAYIANLVAQNKLTQRGQDISLWGKQQDVGLQQQALQAQLAQAQADYAIRKATADRQYTLDAARFGLDRADLLYRQRLSDAQLALQRHQEQLANANFELGQNQFNFNQRNAKAGLEQNALQMLADRKGPQDWVAYNNLLNGLNAPNPQASTTIDPFALLKDLVQQSQIQAPDVPTLASVQGDVPTLAPDPGAAPSWAGATGGYTPSAPTVTGPDLSSYGSGTSPGVVPPKNATTPVSTYSNTGTPWGSGGPTVTANSSVNNPGDNTPGTYGLDHTLVDSLKSGQGQMYTTGRAGPTDISNWDTSNYRVVDPATGREFTGQVPAGYPVWISRLFDGGIVGTRGGGDVPAAVVGDKRKGTTGHEEIAQAEVDPATGRPILRVLNHEQTQVILGKARKGGKKLPKAASGGTYGADLSSPTFTFNTYKPQDLGNQPFYKKLTGATPSREFGSFGATIDNPQLGIYGAPFNISLQRYNQLAPSEQAQTQSLYSQGLGVNWDDILNAARRGAPNGRYSQVAYYGS